MPTPSLKASGRVLVTRLIPESGVALLREAGLEVVWRQVDDNMPRGELLAALSDGCDAVLAMLLDKIDAEAIAAGAPRLRCVANFAVGYDNFDLAAMSEAGVWAANTPDIVSEATADTAWALLMAVARRIVECDAVARSGAWKGWGPMQFLGADFVGATLGIVGAGRIGRATARRSLGFKTRVLYANSRGAADPAFEAEVPGAMPASVDELLAQSDFVSLNCPLTPATRHLISRERIARMKPTAILVNTARGPVVDEEALADALEAGMLGGVGLDVHEREPLMNARLVASKRAVLLPHIGTATMATREGMSAMAARNIVAALSGGEPPNALNWPKGR